MIGATEGIVHRCPVCKGKVRRMWHSYFSCPKCDSIMPSNRVVTKLERGSTV